MTQVSTGSHLQTYLSMEIIKTPQYSKTSLYSEQPQGQIEYNIEDDMIKTPRSLCKLRHDSPLENTLHH